jgi:Aspartyl protease
LTFLKTDSLPVVSVRVNGGDEVTFLIDTGGSEVALDTEFVKELGLPQFSEGLGVKRIDGCIGTNLLYHFLAATLDFPQGELVLRRKPAKSLEQFAAASLGKSVAVPFWIASDHFMVGWGRVETLPPALLFVDTGLAGAGIRLAESVINQAGIKLEEDKASDGAGGGGQLKIVPYTVRRLSFGGIQEDNVVR